MCKWGYYYDEKAKKCIISDAISQIKIDSTSKEKEQGTRNRWKEFMRATLRIIGKSSSSNVNKLSLVVIEFGFSTFIIYSSLF